MSSVSTDLNFPENTEEAFLFYQSVFGGEFVRGGIRRFGDIPLQKGMPSMNEKDKSLVMHVELPIIGGHLLMGTDAPESMGFKVKFGNNIHINLELDTKKETRKYFKALSENGTVTQELEDMFWGSFFGGCIDKFGVQWMFLCNEGSNL